VWLRTDVARHVRAACRALRSLRSCVVSCAVPCGPAVRRCRSDGVQRGHISAYGPLACAVPGARCGACAAAGHGVGTLSSSILAARGVRTDHRSTGGGAGGQTSDVSPPNNQQINARRQYESCSNAQSERQSRLGMLMGMLRVQPGPWCRGCQRVGESASETLHTRPAFFSLFNCYLGIAGITHAQIDTQHRDIPAEMHTHTQVSSISRSVGRPTQLAQSKSDCPPGPMTLRPGRCSRVQTARMIAIPIPHVRCALNMKRTRGAITSRYFLLFFRLRCCR
jgi:hypothetical protein